MSAKPASIKSSRRLSEAWHVKVERGPKLLIEIHETFGEFFFVISDGKTPSSPSPMYKSCWEARVDAWSKVAHGQVIDKIERVVL